MKDQKAKHLLQIASNEIKHLRRENEKITLRLSGFEDALLLLRTQPPYPGKGMSPDVTYDIDKLVAAMDAEELAPRAENALRS